MATQEDYWDKKIKEWTEASYEKKTKNLIEKTASLFRGGITKRMEVALEVVGPKAKGKVILDLGCGLGDFCFRILSYSPKKIIGIDISAVAVKEAIKRAKKRDCEEKVEFIRGNVTQMEKLPNFDIAVGLGFIDYLDKNDLKKLFKLLSGRHFLFSMFEKKFSLMNVLHAVYVKIQRCPGAFKYTREEMKKIIPKESKFYFLEKDKMLFIANLPK